MNAPSAGRALAAVALSAGVLGQGAPTVRHALDVDGRERHYRLHQPAAGGGELPLLLMLHGGEQTAQQAETMSRFSETADRQRFIVAYPEGIERRWNDGRTSETLPDVDDVEFLTAVVDDVASRTPVDRGRVFAVGASNGSMMAARFGCEHPELIAGVAMVIGSLPTELESRCRAGDPLSVLMINGTADPIVPYAGGVVGDGRRGTAGGSVLSATSAAQLWAARSRCAARPNRTGPTDRVRDGTRVLRDSFARCAAGKRVALITIEGGGHQWPGTGGRDARALGRLSREIDASAEILSFFGLARR